MERPEYNISVDRGHIQVRRLTVTDIIVPASQYMATLHKTQLLNARAKMMERNGSYSNSHYTKTEFQLIMALFRRYREELEQKLEGQDLKLLIDGYQELLEHEEAIEKMEKEVKRFGSDTNFELIRRPKPEVTGP